VLSIVQKCCYSRSVPTRPEPLGLKFICVSALFNLFVASFPFSGEITLSNCKKEVKNIFDRIRYRTKDFLFCCSLSVFHIHLFSSRRLRLAKLLPNFSICSHYYSPPFFSNSLKYLSKSSRGPLLIFASFCFLTTVSNILLTTCLCAVLCISLAPAFNWAFSASA
jgi:hypothetical protein